MDGVRGLSGITGTPLVGERNAGNQQQQADAFREAMQETGHRRRHGRRARTGEDAPCEGRFSRAGSSAETNKVRRCTST